MTEKQNCCGCTACLHSCPVHCMTMQEDEEGFLYPVTDQKSCIHCHRCETVCPIQKLENRNTETAAYVGYCRNEAIREQSSSGGIFSVLAEWILQQNGVVFGAAFDHNFEVFHIAIETKAELAKLRGSKYVQSRMGNAYPEVKQYLEMERKVLFTGTACQIAGLKNYLRKEYDNLYTVDVLCHGVPSPKIWRTYLEEQKKQYGASVEKVEFRSKVHGWNNYSVRIGFSGTQQYCVQFSEDQFMRMFLGDLDLRPSCYACRFKALPRSSDMTIGDSWGIERVMPDLGDDKGISVILVHSQKGGRILQEVQEKLITREANLDEVLPPTADSRKSVAMHPNRKKYLRGLQNGESFDVLYGYVRKSFLQKAVDLIRYMAVRFGQTFFRRT